MVRTDYMFPHFSGYSRLMIMSSVVSLPPKGRILSGRRRVFVSSTRLLRKKSPSPSLLPPPATLVRRAETVAVTVRIVALALHGAAWAFTADHNALFLYNM